MSVFEMKDVSYSYDKSKRILTAVNAVFETGKMYAILGVSGSGKTTLLSLLGGLDISEKGEILFDGEDISEHRLEYHRRNHVSLIFQNYNLIDYMTPVENVKLTAKQDALLILKQLGLTEDEAKRNVMKLSGGQQQRVAIARTLASDSPVILADEPTGNLDEDTAAEITEVLKNCAHQMNRCVIIVTHSNDLAKQADMVFRLKKGKLQQVWQQNGYAALFAAVKPVTELERMERTIRRGDIYYAELNLVVGSEQGGTRPVLIISNNMGNRHSPTVIIAATTSRVQTKSKLPTHTAVNDFEGLDKALAISISLKNGSENNCAN